MFTGIIKCISWATVHCNSLFWPPNQSLSGFCNSAFFILLSGLTLYNFFYSLQVGPGFLPLNWKPVSLKKFISVSVISSTAVFLYKCIGE